MQEFEIYYNPSCSKCIYALDFLKSQGINPTVIEYLTNKPSFIELKNLLTKLGLQAADIVRRSESIFIEKFSNHAFSDDELIQLMVDNPILIQRPILVKGNQAVIARSDSSIEKIL